MRWNFDSDFKESRKILIDETESRLDQLSINDIWIDLPVATSIEDENDENNEADGFSLPNSASVRRNLQTAWGLGILLLLTGYLGQSAVLQASRENAVLRPLRVNPNTASLAELQLLEGIGEITASKIVAEREKGGEFSSPGDLERVKGIGPKTVEKLRDSLTFSENND